MPKSAGDAVRYDPTTSFVLFAKGKRQAKAQPIAIRIDSGKLLLSESPAL
jgi:hypothetical protein